MPHSPLCLVLRHPRCLPQPHCRAGGHRGQAVARSATVTMSLSAPDVPHRAPWCGRWSRHQARLADLELLHFFTVKPNHDTTGPQHHPISPPAPSLWAPTCVLQLSKAWWTMCPCRWRAVPDTIGAGANCGGRSPHPGCSPPDAFATRAWAFRRTSSRRHQPRLGGDCRGQPPCCAHRRLHSAHQPSRRLVPVQTPSPSLIVSRCRKTTCSALRPHCQHHRRWLHL